MSSKPGANVTDKESALSAQYQLEDLLYLMTRLRHPEHGCPWDLKQDYQTIAGHTLEEAYEVVDAINRGNKHDLKDELGDLLFQIVFYAQFGQEEGVFDFADVVDNVVTKLVRRHPHVFPEGDLKRCFPTGTKFSDEQIKAQWETIKQEERRLKESPKDQGLLADIPSNLPALNRAEKLQKRASQHGFDWSNIEPVFDKVAEELAELKTVLAQDLPEAVRQQRVQDELGDVLFSCVNLARFLKVSPDQALRQTNAKFVRRFEYIEERLIHANKSLADASLAELDALWEQAKATE